MKITSSDRMTLDQALSRLRDDQRPSRSDLASQNTYPTQSWDLNTDFASARKYANEGWQDRARDLEGCMATIKQVVENSLTFDWDVAGESVDVGRYLSGEPECMLQFPAPQTQSVRFLVNISARASLDAKVLFNRGIAVAALVYALQSAGIGVSLSIGEWSSEDRSPVDCHETIVEVNNYSEYINPARLAFWLSHPAVLRRCVFRYNEQQDPNVRAKFGFGDGRGYGYPTDPSSEVLKKHDAIYFPFPETGQSGLYESPLKAFETVKAIAEKQGVKLDRRSWINAS